MSNEYADKAEVFKAIADENRLKILELLRHGEKCGNDLLDKVNVSQSTLSHHMKVMCASGIVTSRKDGTSTYYSIDTNGSLEAIKLLYELTNISPVEIEVPQTIQTNSVVQHGSKPNGWLL